MRLDKRVKFLKNEEIECFSKKGKRKFLKSELKIKVFKSEDF